MLFIYVAAYLKLVTSFITSKYFTVSQCYNYMDELMFIFYIHDFL